MYGTDATAVTCECSLWHYQVSTVAWWSILLDMAQHAMASPPLGEIKRQAVIDHVLACARRLVLTTGLDVTMDQLADASGVSRRTLFRHFATREKLLAAAFEAGMAGYRHQLPRFDGDLDRWLRATCETVHRLNSTIGPGFFELASRSDLPPDLAAAESRRRREFRAAMVDITNTLWGASGRTGPAPTILATTVTLHLSPFFTAASSIDADKGWESAADAAYAAIGAAVAR